MLLTPFDAISLLEQSYATTRRYTFTRYTRAMQSQRCSALRRESALSARALRYAAEAMRRYVATARRRQARQDMRADMRAHVADHHTLPSPCRCFHAYFRRLIATLSPLPLPPFISPHTLITPLRRHALLFTPSSLRYYDFSLRCYALRHDAVYAVICYAMFCCFRYALCARREEILR